MDLPGVTVLFRIQQFSEARIFLKEGEVFIVTGVETVCRPEFDGNFEVGHGGISFAGKAIKGRKRVVHVICLGRKLARLLEAFARFVPAAQVHHGHATLIVILGRFGVVLRGWLHALLNNAQMGARAICEFFARTFENLFQLLLRTLEFLLMEKTHSLFIQLHLCLNAWIDQFNAATLWVRSG